MTDARVEREGARHRSPVYAQQHKQPRNCASTVGQVRRGRDDIATDARVKREGARY